jgi:hypothetical protein
MTTQRPLNVVSEGERQFIASLNSMVSCDTPILMTLQVVGGLAAHLTRETGLTDPDKMAGFINRLSKASGLGLVAVASSALVIDDGPSVELLLYRKECCKNAEYQMTVDALLNQLGLNE